MQAYERRAIAFSVSYRVDVVRYSMNMRRLNFAPRPAPRGRDGKELIQCPTSSCDGMGHVSGNYATHRRQGSIDIDIDILQSDDIRLCIIYILI